MAAAARLNGEFYTMAVLTRLRLIAVGANSIELLYHNNGHHPPPWPNCMFVLNNLLPAQRTGAVHPKYGTRGLNTTCVKNRSVCQEENGRVTYCIALVGWFMLGTIH